MHRRPVDTEFTGFFNVTNPSKEGQNSILLVSDSVSGRNVQKNHSLNLHNDLALTFPQSPTSCQKRRTTLLLINRVNTESNKERYIDGKNLGILFFLRKPRPFRKDLRLVSLQMTVDGISKELSLKRTWEKAKMEITGCRLIEAATSTFPWFLGHHRHRELAR